jgi:hypothetical protein
MVAWCLQLSYDFPVAIPVADGEIVRTLYILGSTDPSKRGTIAGGREYVNSATFWILGAQ